MYDLLCPLFNAFAGSRNKGDYAQMALQDGELAAGVMCNGVARRRRGFSRDNCVFSLRLFLALLSASCIFEVCFYVH